MSKKQMQAVIYGRVQGVSFRYYTQQEALKLGIRGWVANQWDGTVRAVAEGDEPVLQQFLHFLHQGSPHARVDRVKCEWCEAVGEFSRFEIRHL